MRKTPFVEENESGTDCSAIVVAQTTLCVLLQTAWPTAIIGNDNASRGGSNAPHYHATQAGRMKQTSDRKPHGYAKMKHMQCETREKRDV